MTLPEKFKVLVITLSDRAHSGSYPDLSGPAVVKYVRYAMKAAGWNCEIKKIILPDDAVALRAALTEATEVDLIITTGGTGIGPRDITPEVVTPVFTKEIPGIMEQIRVKYGTKNPKALLSRGVAGAIGNTLVYTLPGSVKAVHEYMAEIVKTMEHTFYMLYGIDNHK
ncbi:MAG: MogA/MoaB family molybdenum cofactor biosynthesis protein [Bacteroidales bacterium]|jgi:molybdenum cofactor synthesis domain-containing protein|nr:MogA/MoaB family molybdenum cofactor biosynthesis protein [Bacteroidales bacterium]MCB9029188.1 MogA/MoaB family molybdenum cofactor biosynthesis protein [Bacteroidales bacterium]NLE36334.1 MogA/MoaB family molybdenum cofactor biosynthesis protein [Bacteroidales bacterium]HOO67102.1 MogA/MoaB family molybdenum cofactor biosynthesis protein [Bacteroidales bacterium]HPE23456.1 MogA/MoaB family molybdenum cofactor biosynthesis protein [Bacteroidales bacterium]